MKRLFSYILLLAVCATACTEVCDHIPTPPPPEEPPLVGTWYEVGENEEIRFSKSGTFYDKYCKKDISWETEGRWEFDKENMRLTYTYEFMGQMQFADWKVADLSELSFTIYTDQVGSHKLERVVETFNLGVGESCTISYFDDKPEYTVTSIQTSSRIVSIDKDSYEITATGEKGTAYIKVETNQGTTWAKVVVGDECLDLWYDYVSFIGKDYAYMTKDLGTPSINGEDGYSFGYSMIHHDLLYEVDFFMEPSTGLVDEIGLVLQDGAPAAQIKSYMDARYYPTNALGVANCYTTSPTLQESVAILQYQEEQNVVWIMDASFFKMPDYADDLGKTEEEIVAKYGELYYGMLPFYEVSNHYGYSIYFIISETTGAVTAAQFTLMPDIQVDEVHNILSGQYNHYQTDETNTKFAYRNAGKEDSTIMVIYNAEDATVTWFDLLNYGK